MNYYLCKDIIIKDFVKNGLLIDVERARYQKINQTGLFIIKQLSKEKVLSIEKILEKVSENYQIPVKLIQDDIISFVNDLVSKRFLNTDEDEKIQLKEEKEAETEDGNGIWIQVTNGCNIRCKYCYADAGCSTEDLTLEEIETILLEVKDLSYNKIVITGGEPLIRKDILDIVKICKKYGAVQLLSNGISQDKELYKSIIELVDMLQISIDSPTKEIHDANRGKGSFDKAMETLKFLATIAPQKLTVAMTPTPEYMADLVEMIKLCLSLHVSILHVNRFVPYGRASEYSSEMNLNDFFAWADKGYEYLLSLYEAAYREKKNFQFNLDIASDLRVNVMSLGRKCSCGLNENLVSVGYNGDVYLCPSLHVEEYKLGSVRENSIKEIIEAGAKKYGSFCVEELSCCKNCDIKYYCGGGCRALALRKNNNIYGKDGNCASYEKRVYDLMLR